jgi:Arc/MetJ family transcription regulator
MAATLKRSTEVAQVVDSSADRPFGLTVFGLPASKRQLGVERSHSHLMSSTAAQSALVDVYDWCMARTNIDLDDKLIAEVMRRFGVSTKKEAVDLALRRLVGEPLTSEFLLGLEGVGWDGDLERLRREKPDEFS